MNKGKKRMKKNKKANFKVKGPEAIEDGLMEMGSAMEVGGPWMHPEKERIPEWRGADVRHYFRVFAFVETISDEDMFYNRI
jgi:hypothetical protein